MLFIERPDTDPFFNLAAEEYLFRNYKEDVIMLWRNTPAVIIGKHQNPYREVNLAFAREIHLPVIRRISGGGAVYHDLGNLNFTFIRTGQAGDLVNYWAFLDPLVSILNSWQIPCELSGKSDLMIRNRKISGNSQHVFKNRVMHHGTLLYTSDLETLSRALRNKTTRYRDRSIRSNRAPVANISDFLANPIPITQFQNQLSAELMRIFTPSTRIHLSWSDKRSIHNLVQKKYGTWEWNFGYSPPYHLKVHFLIDGKKQEIEISVKNGIIQKIHIFDSMQFPGWMPLFSEMEGLQHEENTIRNHLDAHPGLLKDFGLSTEELIRGLF